MTMVRYNIQTGANGSVLIPTTPFADGAEIEVVVREKYEKYREEMPVRSDLAEKTPEQDFLDFCEELAMPSLSDDEVNQIKYERLKGKYM